MVNQIEAMKQWAESVSKAYDLTAWGHSERAAEILRQTRNSIRTAIEEAEKQKKWVEVECPLCGEMAVAHTHPVLHTQPAAQPALKPLTDEQRLDVINKTWNKYLQGEGHDSFGWCLTEAIEAAHGITGEQK